MAPLGIGEVRADVDALRVDADGLAQLAPDPLPGTIMLGGLACFLWGLVARYAAWRRPGTVRVSRGQIHAGAILRMPLEAVRSGWWCAEKHKWRVELTLTNGTRGATAHSSS